MKNLILTFLFTISLFSYSPAQTFKTTYDPSYKTETGSGFYSDFEFVVTGIESQTKATVIELASVKTNLEKGWYEKKYSTKAKLYPCGELKGLCATTLVGGFWIHIEWEYAGKVYENGGQFNGKQMGDKFSFIKVKNFFTPPSEIPASEIAKATIKNISIASCSYNTSNEIFKLVSKIK